MRQQHVSSDVAEEQWCSERRGEVATYLDREGVTHGSIGDWPAWHVAPHVSVWAVESLKSPGWVGWWVTYGDLPTDYVSSEFARNPRDAVRAIVQRWRDLVPYLERGQSSPSATLGTTATAEELAPLLKARAELLGGWVNDAAVWPK